MNIFKRIIEPKSSYNIWQKAFSIVCSIVLLAPLIVRGPQSQAAPAGAERNLVVLFVESSLFSGSVDNEENVIGKINRYAQDIQATLPLTRTLLLPTPANTSAGDMFRILEKLYLEGMEKEERRFTLTGTVLIGDLPLPIIRANGRDVPSVFPLTDLTEPAFLWDEQAEVFRENSSSREMAAEIFHGVIRAPKDEEKTEQEWLLEFFDKNHAYHTGELETPEQKILLADFIEEASALHPSQEGMYEAAEGVFAADLSFYRYNNSLLSDVNTLKEQVTSNAADMSELPQEIQENWSAAMEEMKDFPLPDSLTYESIRKLLPTYTKTVDRYMGKVASNIEGSGRWMLKEETADTIPGLITKMDVLSKEFLRSFSISTEGNITEFVETEWQQPVPILESVFAAPKSPFWIDDGGDDYDLVKETLLYFHGKPAEEVVSAEECSLFRGSAPQEPRPMGDASQLTEMNHIWNKHASDEDQELYKTECKEYAKCCLRYMSEPEVCKPDRAIWDVYDEKGGLIKNEEDEASFLDCTKVNIPELPGLVMPYFDPFGYLGTNWETTPTYPPDFSNPENGFTIPIGENRYSDMKVLPPYTFDKISSVVVHDEPRPDTIASALEDVVSGAIPADEIRHVTFQGNGGETVRIDFPDFFDTKDTPENPTAEEMRSFIKNIFKEKEDEIRGLMMASNFESYLTYLSSRRHGIKYDGSRVQPQEDILTFLLTHEYLREQASEILEKDKTLHAQFIISLLENTKEEQQKKIIDMLKSDNPISKSRETVLKILQSTYPNALSDAELWLAFAEGEEQLSLAEEISDTVQEIFDFSGPFFIGYPRVDTGVDESSPQMSNSDKLRENIPSFGEFLKNNGEVFTAPSPIYNPFLEIGHNPLRDTVFFPVTEIPENGFLMGENGDIIETLGGDILLEFLLWRALSVDEKHKRVLELFYGEKGENILSEKNSYELGIFRAEGNANEMWWKRQNEAYLFGDDPEWDAANAEETGTDGDSDEDDDEKDECTGKSFREGVSIVEWLPAFTCWVEKTAEAPVKIETTNACNFTPIADWGGSNDTFDDLLNFDDAIIPPGSYMTVESLRGTSIPEGESTEIVIRFLDPDGEPIIGGIPFTIDAEEGAHIMTIQSTEETQLKDRAYAGEYTVTARTTSASGMVTVTAAGFAKQVLHLVPVNDGSVELQAQKDDDNPFLHKVYVTVKGGAGQTLTDFIDTANAALSDTSVANLSNTEIAIQNGVGEILVEMLSSQPVELSVTLPGFAPGVITLLPDELESEIIGLLLVDFPDSLNLHEERVLRLVAVDANGKEYPVSAGTTLTATSKTAHLADIENLGEGSYLIKAKDITGTLRLVAKSPGLETETMEIPVVQKIFGEEMRSLPAKGVVSALFGANFADFAEEKTPLANALLFSGESQAVLSSLTKNSAALPRASVYKNGEAELFDRGLETKIVSLAPLQIRIFDSFSAQNLAEYSLSFSQNTPTGILDSTSATSRSGMFFRPLDTSGRVNGSVVENVVQVTFDDKTILSAERNGSFTIADNRFSLLLKEYQETPTLQLLFEAKTVVGEFLLYNPTVTLLNGNKKSLELFPVPGNENGSLGFVVTNPEKESSVLPSGGKTLENIKETFAPGLNEDDNFALQFGSGTHIGNASKGSFGPTGVLLGDPTIVLGQDRKLVSGYNRGIGKEILSTTMSRNDFVLPFRFDNNTLPDILLASKKGEIRVLRNRGDMEFDNKGPLFLTPEGGIDGIAAADIDGDFYDDLLVLDDEGSLSAFRNIESTFLPFLDIELPNAVFTNIQAHDMDSDGFPDLIAQETNGDISVFWGNASGYSADRRFLLEGFGPRVEEGNLALDNTMISYAGIFEDKENTYPLSLLNPSGEEEGIENGEILETPEEVKDAEQEMIDANSDVWGMLETLQENFGDAVEADFFDNRAPSFQTRIGLFASINDVPGITVSLFASDENGGILQKDDEVIFRLEVQNSTGETQHFSLAHMLNPALQIQENSLELPENWPEERGAPRLEDLGEEGIRIINLLLENGESHTLTFTGVMQEESIVTTEIRENIDLPPNNPADGLADIALIIPGIESHIFYLSQENRTFTQVISEVDPADIPEHLLALQKDEDTICNEEEVTDEDSDGDGILNTEDTNNGCIPDTFETDEDGDGNPDYAQNALNPYSIDADRDGVPDIWDNMIGNPDVDQESWKDTLSGLGDFSENIESYTSCDGGCLDIPVNFAFLVPGPINIFESVAGALMGDLNRTVSGGGGVSANSGVGINATISEDVKAFTPAITKSIQKLGPAVDSLAESAGELVSSVGGKLGLIQKGSGIYGGVIPAGVPVFGLLGSLPFVCAGPTCNTSASPFRIYLSPTLTGAVGIGICTGPWGGGARCMAFAPSVLNISSLCPDTYSGSKQFPSTTDSGNGCTIGSSKENSRGSISSGNSNDIDIKGIFFALDSLGSFTVSYNTGNNKRVMNFPWNWVYEQQAEFHAMFSKMPNITIYYPDLFGDNEKYTDEFENLLGKIPGAEVITEPGGQAVEGGIEGAQSTWNDLQNIFSSEDDRDFYEAMAQEDLNAQGKLDGTEDATEKRAAINKHVREKFEEKIKALTKETKETEAEARESLGGFEELYDAINALPLIKLQTQEVHIKVPYLSRAHIFALREDITYWIEDAEKEIQRAKDNWAACPPDADPEEFKTCQAKRAVQEKIIVNADKLVATGKENIEILQGYLSQPQALANLDMGIALWISQAICSVDSSVLYLRHWFVKNKRRLEMWMELADIFEETKNIWKALADIFVDYENYCPICRVDRGESVMTVFNITFGSILTPPIIRFPRLPDIVIDLSKIKGNIVIPVPKPKLHFMPIIFPKLPRMQLMGAPLWEITLPAMPELPKFPVMPALPPFPAVPKITLPDLPPAPKLPDMPNALAEIIGSIRPLLLMLCTFKQGFMPLDEMTELKPVIESLTARPSMRMFNVDFAGALFDDFTIPSVRTIEITTEVNLDFSVGDTLVNAMESAFKPWNNIATDTRGQLNDLRKEIYTDIQESFGGAHTNENIERIQVDDLFSHKSSQDKVIEGFEKHFASLIEAYFSEDQEYLSSTEIRARLGKTPIQLPDELPAIAELNEMRSGLIALQEKYTKEAQLIAKHGDLTRLEGSFVSDSFLASKVYDTSVSLQLPENPDTEDRLFLQDNISEGDPERGTEEESTPIATTYAGEEGIQYPGVYSQCGDGGEKLISNDSFAENIDFILAEDLDGDGDKDMILANRYQVLVKENYTETNIPVFLTNAPEIGTLEYFLPSGEATKNVRAKDGIEKITVRFSANFDSDLLGIAIVAKEQKHGFFLPEDTEKEDYVTLLLPSRYIPEDNNPKSFMTGDVFIENIRFKGQLLMQELTKEQVRIPLPPRHWFIQVKEIRADGLGTGSEIRLAYSEEEIIEEENEETAENSPNWQTFSLDPLPDEVHYAASDTPMISVRATDAYGNFTEEERYVSVPAPEIFIDKKKTSTESVYVSTTPRMAGVPFFLFRERGKFIKEIASNMKKETDEFGKNIIEGFSQEKGLFLQNRQEEKLAEIEEGKVRLLSDEIDIVASNSGKMGIIYSETARVLAEIVPVSSGDSDVIILSGETTLREAQTLPRGTSIADRNLDDAYTIEPLPGSAPTFPGGVALLYGEQILALLSAKGEVHMLDDRLTFRVKKPKNHDGFLIRSFLDVSGRERFDIFTKTQAGEAILLSNTEKARKYYKPKDFVLLEEKNGIHKTLKKPLTGEDILFIAEKLNRCESCETSIPLFGEVHIPLFTEACKQKNTFRALRALFPLLSNDAATFLSLEEAKSVLDIFAPGKDISLENANREDFVEALKRALPEKTDCLPTEFPSDTRDMCPNIPEDNDGVDDEDGCPEYDFHVQFTDIPEGMYVTSGYTDGSTPLVDYKADIREGDILSAKIFSEEKNVILKSSLPFLVENK